MPPIGKADHDIVYIEYDIKAKRLKQASSKIYLYKRADMVGLKDHMTQFKDAYLSEDHSHMSVNDENKILCAMDRLNDQTACEEKN